MHILLHSLGSLQCWRFEVMVLSKRANLVHLQLPLYMKETENGVCVYI